MTGALVITAKAPAPAGVKTRLAPLLSAAQTIALQGAFIADTVRLARSVAASDVTVMCPRGESRAVAEALSDPGTRIVEQTGTGLEAALEEVFEDFTSDGRPAIALDSDTPHLAPASLALAFQALTRADLAVGPTPDGGYYLVGARRSCRGLFAASGLGTGTALQQLTTNADARGMSVWTGPEEFDVDRPEDLFALIRLLRREPQRAPNTASLLEGWAIRLGAGEF